MDGRELANALEGMLRSDAWRALALAAQQRQVDLDALLHNEKTPRERLGEIAAEWRGVAFVLAEPARLIERGRREA